MSLRRLLGRVFAEKRAHWGPRVYETNKVRWSFVFQTLCMKGFSPKWIQWVETFISSGSVAINVNDEVGHYFQTKKGLRQGDPLSPLLFNIVADMLAILIKRANEDGQMISGVVPHLVVVYQYYNMLMTPYSLWNII